MRHYTYRVFVPSQDGSVVVDLPVADPATATMLVVQSTLASRSVRVILDDLQVLAATAHYPMDTVKDLLREFERFRATQVTVQQQLRDANDALKDALDATQRDQESVSEQLTAAQSRLIQAESLLARRNATLEGAPPQSERLCGSDDANDDERSR